MWTNKSTNDQKISEEIDQQGKAKKIALISIFLNLLLAIAKILIFFFYESISLLADGFDSGLDLFASLFSFLAIKLASKPPDKEHPFGHYKYENLFSLGIALLLFSSSGIIGYQAINRLISQTSIPFSIANIIIASISIIIKGLLVWLNLIIGKQIQSQVLIATGLNFRTDVLVSVVVLISVSIGHLSIGSFSLFWIDPIIALLITIFIVITAINVSKESIGGLLDKSPEKEVMGEIRSIITQTAGVKEINDLRVRKIGSRISGDVSIAVDPMITVKKGHDIAHNVLRKLKSELQIIDYIIHVEPYYDNEASEKINEQGKKESDEND